MDVDVDDGYDHDDEGRVDTTLQKYQDDYDE